MMASVAGGLVAGRLGGAALAGGLFLAAVLATGTADAQEVNGIVVYQSDFGVADGAVSTMKGVALSVDPTLRLEDLTHEIPAFSIWDGAYNLHTTMPYWPEGTVFVSVVDPGVGTDRSSVVMLTESGHFVVTPDNGTLTLVADTLGVTEVREIDESQHRLPGSEGSHTFHGRDVYSITAARLASGTITFEEVGPSRGEEYIAIPYQQAALEDGLLAGAIPILDVQFGNVWTNIEEGLFAELGAALGDPVAVRILEGEEPVWEGEVPYVTTFGDVPEGDPLLYVNSVGNMALALNWDDFAGTFGIASGSDWRVEMRLP